MSDRPRYQSLRDYLDVVRDHAVLIVVAALVCAAAAYALSARAEPTYEAQASLAFEDENAALGELGAAVPVTQTPEQRAAIGAERVQQLAVARRAKRILKSREPAVRLLDAVTAAPESRTNLVVIRAQWTDGRYAARVANAFGRAMRDLTIDRVRRGYRRRARALRGSLRELPRGDAGELTRSLTADRIARFETLAELATPVDIATRATTPGAPLSPKPLRNAILALLAGLTVGLVAAFLRDILDRRMSRPADVAAALDLPILGTVERRLIGRSVMSEGRRAVAGADLEAFRIIRRNLDVLTGTTPPRTVLVTSTTAEEGKTTVAVTLGAVAAMAGRRVLLVECDLRRPGVGRLVELGRGPGLAEYVAGTATPDEAIRNVPVPSAGDGATLAVLPAGRPVDQPAELLASGALHEGLRALAETYDLVILDAPPVLPVVDALELEPLADAVVLCVRGQSTTRDEARAAAAALRRSLPQPIGVVVTAPQRPAPQDRYDYTAKPALAER